MNRLVLFTVVAISGAAVLVLELLGTRVLGPAYGVSLSLWSVLIAVTLAALACGYALGGQLATRRPDGQWLAPALSIAGIWVLAVPWLHGPVVRAADALGARGGMLAAATLLFFPPLTLLGMVGPGAIRLGAHSVEDVGRASGNVLAVSTLASVAAALATGFVLIPSLGVSRLLVAVALALFAAAALVRLARGPAGALVLLLAGVGLAAAASGRPARTPAAVLAGVDGAYGRVRVVEWKGLRYLTIDGGVHTVFDAESGEPHQGYVYAAELAADVGPPRGRLLLVGLGGGGAAQVFARRGWRVDAVELDTTVVRLAGEFFRLRPFHASVRIGDGRAWLRRLPERYDVVLLDAFGSASIPFHLLTREAFAQVRARLVPGGVAALNVEAIGWQDPLVPAVAATLRTQFAHVVALPVAEPPTALGNVVLLASDRELALPDDVLGDPVASLSDEDEHFRVLARHHAWENRYDPRRGVVLTDDWNPSDLRADEINLASRRWLRSEFPDSLRAD